MPTPLDEPTRRRMQRQSRRDTGAELQLRRAVHALGLRYRVDAALPVPSVRRRADLLFTGAKVAVFVDGCFWHRCPVHGTSPRNNAEWWSAKLDANVARDRDTDRRLQQAGWASLRVWEHEETASAASRVVAAVRTALSARGRPLP
jgi:DNA mismatch endonuclease (patch repair protein)